MAIDDRIYRIEKWHGEENARLAVREPRGRRSTRSNASSVPKRSTAIFAASTAISFEAEDGEDDLDKELDAAHRLGFTNVEMVDSVHRQRVRDGPGASIFPIRGNFTFSNICPASPRRSKRTAARFSRTRERPNGQGGDAPRSNTDGGHTITAKSIVLATNYPIMSKMFAKLPAYRTYVIGARVPKGAVEPMLFWDTLDPYHYVRTQPEDDHDVLIVGGEDHRTGQENDGDERFDKLVAMDKRAFPAAEELTYKWSGQCFRNARRPGVYRQIFGQRAERLPHHRRFGDGDDARHDRRDARLGSDPRPREPVGRSLRPVADRSPNRSPKPCRKLSSSTVPYVDWVTGGDVVVGRRDENGEGAIIRDGLTKIAAYRDEDGKLHKRSAVCTHMGCIVQFNSSEKTWDCPCHGSRFGIDGHVINTPAISPLAAVEEDS